MGYRSQALDQDRHRLDRFDPGEPDLDVWLQQHACGAQSRNVARTFVWVPADADTMVVAYYTLSGHKIGQDDLPRRIGRGSPREIPAILLARLALDKRLHGQGLGAALLADAMERVVQASQIAAARFVVVDALHENAVSFYERHGFRRIPDTLRLVQKVSALAISLDQ